MKTMKTILFLLLACSACKIYAQDTIFLDNNRKELTVKKNYEYYKIIEKDKQNTDVVIEKTYYKTDQIIEENYYSSYSNNTKHGKYRVWYLNGKIKRDIDYLNGSISGKLLTYWENGQIKRNDTFVNGKFVEGQIKNSDGANTQHYDYEIMPVYPGGTNELVRYVGKETKYPKKARKKGIKGKVVVKFVVSKSGEIIDAIIVKSVDHDLDKEALRVVNGMPNWEPGMFDGEKVPVYFNLPINFTFKD